MDNLISLVELIHFGKSSYLSRRLHQSDLPNEFLESAVLSNGDHLSFGCIGIDVDEKGYAAGMQISIPEYRKCGSVFNFQICDREILIEPIYFHEVVFQLKRSQIPFVPDVAGRQIAFPRAFMTCCGWGENMKTDLLCIYLL